MSDIDSPAGRTGGPVPVPALDDLPEKLRVHALARLLGRTSKEVLATLAELGVEARSAQSSVLRKDAEQVVTALLPPAEGDAPGDPGEVTGGPAAGLREDDRGAAADAAPAASDPVSAASTPASVPEPTAPAGSPPVPAASTPATGPEPTAPAPAVGPPAPAQAVPAVPLFGAAEPAAAAATTPVFAPATPLFQPPAPATRTRRRSRSTASTASSAAEVTDTTDSTAAASTADAAAAPAEADGSAETLDTTLDTALDTALDGDADTADTADAGPDDDGEGGRRRRRRGRRGRGRGRGADDATDEPDDSGDAERGDGPAQDADSADTADTADTDAGTDEDETDDEEAGESDESGGSRRRRRRRRRRGNGDDADDSGAADPPNTVTRLRSSRGRDSDADRDSDDGVQSVRGSTRLEAKRQRRRDGRDAGRRRVPILSEAEFLARRESVDRAMVVRERGDRVEIAVLEDDVLVEHFVTGGVDGSGNGTGKSIVGNIYLGRVQNVLPSMEAAFVDIGRGRNAVLYAGEVDWDAAGLGGKARRIEQALSSGDSVLVQVTKDPLGHKGARLTTQISLAGRFLVYVPSGGAAGISRKLPDVERRRLKDMLKEIVPSEAGVIIRTASEGVSQEALERDVRRLQAQWEVVKGKAEATGPSRPKAPSLLYEEPDLLIKVVRDQFNEDFSTLVVAGDDAWDTVSGYVGHVAPELVDRLHRHVGPADVFAEYRIDEQLLKALDRKVWLPSGGTLVIDRTEAMTVIDVNTGKFTGSGGNLEETVTRNNLEAAEEVVRQLRLRDIGGIIVIDFIDMVLEANRDLVLRRLTECLARDRTRHQVAEVTSLGLVQMTRKRVGGGLLEHFSTTCEHCRGRGVVVNAEPVAERVETGRGPDRDGRRSRGGRRRGDGPQAGDGGRNGRSADAERGPVLPEPAAGAAGPGTGQAAEPAEPASAEAVEPVAPAEAVVQEAVVQEAVAQEAVEKAVVVQEALAAAVSAVAAPVDAPAATAAASTAAPAGPGVVTERAEASDRVGPGVVAEQVGTADQAGTPERTAAAAAVAVTGSSSFAPAAPEQTASPEVTTVSAGRTAGPTPDPAGDRLPNGVADGGGGVGGVGAADAAAPAPRARRRAVRRNAGAPSVPGGEATVAVVTVAATDGAATDGGAASTGPATGASTGSSTAGVVAGLAGVVPQPEPTATARPRRARRVASRPAGPPAAEAGEPVPVESGGDPV
ncbi:MAG: translation initiation factor IF-2 N-terminal domain-containing protein [Pseudonocardia sp.]